ncbi:MAG: hypothetical protein WC756_15500 [Taibaiella sp.]|jgi:hypothetical protein
MSEESNVLQTTSQEEYERKKAEYDLLVKTEKQHYHGLIEKSSDYFEKQVIYVAAGTLTAMVFILDKFFKNSDINYNLIFYSWAFCGGTIVINLVSHFAAVHVFKHIHRKLPAKTKQEEKILNRKLKFSLYFNLVSLISYFIGIIVFFVFIKQNINYLNLPQNIHKKVEIKSSKN